MILMFIADTPNKVTDNLAEMVTQNDDDYFMKDLSVVSNYYNRFTYFAIDMIPKTLLNAVTLLTITQVSFAGKIFQSGRKVLWHLSVL